MGYPYDPYGQEPPRTDPNMVVPPAYGYGYQSYPQQPAQYPYAGYPQQQPGQYPYAGYYPPPPRSRTGLYVGIAIAAVVVVALGVTIPLLLWGSDEPEKPPPTASPSEMILDEDDYTEYDDFVSNEGTGDDDWTETTPKVCDFLTTFKRPSDADYATASWNSGEDIGDPFTTVMVESWADDRLADQAEVVENDCQSFSYTDTTDEGDVTEVEAEAFPVKGADASTVGTLLSFHYPDGSESITRWYETVVRETTVRLGMGFDGDWTDEDEAAAVELLNKQIQKVRDAE